MTTISDLPIHAPATAGAATASGRPADFQLTPQQIRHFELFGFLQLKGLISDRIAAVESDFERVWHAHGGGHAGAPHDGERRSCIYPFIDQDGGLSALLDDHRIHGLLVTLLGEDFNYIGSDGNFYAGDTPWHTDGRHEGPRYLKVAIYLDRIDAASGALRVVPGSHRVGEAYAEQTRALVPAAAEQLSVAADGVPAVALTNEPGDVVVFNHNLLHGAFHGSRRRRMFTLNCCAHHSPVELPELQKYLGWHARFLIERNVGPAMLATAGEGRMRHLRQVLENDFGILEQLPGERAKRAEPSRG
jgi:hypothetical protein